MWDYIKYCIASYCNGAPLQYPCLENPMDGGAWWAAVHGVTNSWTQLSSSLSLFTFMHWRRKWQPTPVFLPGESQGLGSLVGCRLQGRTESDNDWSDLAVVVSSICFYSSMLARQSEGLMTFYWSGLYLKLWYFIYCEFFGSGFIFFLILQWNMNYPDDWGCWHLLKSVIVAWLLSYIQLFVTLWTAARQASLSFPISQSLLKFMFIELVILSNRLILFHLFFLSSVFPKLRAFCQQGGHTV